MKVERVAKLKPTDRFLYWIEERHNIYLRKEAGEPKPWTDDEVLQQYYFTNPYRENDKTTVWFRRNVRDPMRDTDGVVFATVCFRWFNRISTGEVLLEHDLLRRWRLGVAKRCLRKVGRVFTGAFIIGAPKGRTKIDAICEYVDNVWQDRVSLCNFLHRCNRLRVAHGRFTRYPGMGGFMAYEVVCDLRYTRILEDATDKSSWCNPGPGARRGLNRLCNRSLDSPIHNWGDKTKCVLALVTNLLPDMPRFEMREIEHSLCEFDKYERARTGSGRLKRTYKGR